MKAIMDAQELKRLIAATKDFIGDNDVKPVHTYIKLDFYAEESAVRASSVNGYALSTEWARCHDVDEDFSVLIKPVLPPIPKYSNALVEKLEDKKTSISIGGMNLTYQAEDASKFLDVDAAPGFPDCR